MPPLFFDQQLDDRELIGVVIFSFDSLPEQKNKKYHHVTSLQTERVK